ncbi:MAG: acetyl-CoA carboxylase biotin carboxyl carrier protein [Candidatus Zixiibacteriota bacterium]
MNEKYIRKLIRLVEESEIESLEVTRWGRKISIKKRLEAKSNGHSETPAVLTAVVPSPAAAPVPSTAPAPAGPQAAPPTPVDTGQLVEIKSPMVGTFYAAPSPDAPPYVSVNERITVGQVVCIVEAMKLMNEIESEVSGRVVEILAENAKPVEFGQVLFRIDPKG